MKFMLIRLIMAFLWVICAYKWSDWKNWKRYYPTMLFMGMGDLIYYLVFHDKPLWKFQTDFLVPSLNELFVIFTIFFSTILLFLSKLPKKLSKQITWILLWILIYTVQESLASLINMFTYHNGWNIWWSALHNIIMFPLLILHQKKPILAWTISLIFLFIIMSIFNVPFTLKK